MAARKAVLLDQLPDGSAERAERAVRSSGSLALGALVRDAVGAKLSRRGRATLVEALERRGLERTSKGFRVPLAEQVQRAVAASGELALKGAKRAVAGASTDAEVKRAALELVRCGELVLGVRERGEVVAQAGERWLSPAEIGELRSTLERLGKLVKKTSPKRGLPAATLDRQSIAEMLGVLGAERGVGDGLVLGELIELARARGHSVFVPELVLRVRQTAPATTPAQIHDVLLAAAERGEIELRPESGVGLLSEQEQALCVRAGDGTVLSYVRPRT
jgi:hypothetical protein